MSKLIKMVVKKSDKPEKKYVAIFTRENGREKKTYFGQAGALDYLKTGDKERRSRYRSRHRKDLKTNDPSRSGYLSWFLLWGESTSLRENIRNYKKRFNLK
jgi:hypothetical protein